MKIAVALCVLAVLCTADAFNGLNQLKFQLDKSKSTVDSAIKTLERLDSNTQYDTKRRAQNLLFEEMQNHNNYMNPTIEKIRTDVEAAKAEGKNAQPCYDDALAVLRNVGNKARTDGDQCIKSAESSIKNELSFIEGYLATGRQLKSQLDSIFPNCFSNNVFQMQSCIAIQLGSTNMLVRNFESNAKSAEYTAKNESNKIVLQARNCAYNAYSTARTEITNTKISADKCVKNL